MDSDRRRLQESRTRSRSRRKSVRIVAEGMESRPEEKKTKAARISDQERGRAMNVSRQITSVLAGTPRIEFYKGAQARTRKSVYVIEGTGR